MEIEMKSKKGNGNRKKNANLIVETNAEYTCEM